MKFDQGDGLTREILEKIKKMDDTEIVLKPIEIATVGYFSWMMKNIGLMPFGGMQRLGKELFERVPGICESIQLKHEGLPKEEVFRVIRERATDDVRIKVKTYDLISFAGLIKMVRTAADGLDPDLERGLDRVMEQAAAIISKLLDENGRKDFRPEPAKA